MVIFWQIIWTWRLCKLIPGKPDLPVENYKRLSERLTNSYPRLLPGLNPSDPLAILKATSPARLSPLLRHQEWGRCQETAWMPGNIIVGAPWGPEMPLQEWEGMTHSSTRLVFLLQALGTRAGSLSLLTWAPEGNGMMSVIALTHPSALPR